MSGLLGLGVHIPHYRLPCEAIAQVFGSAAGRGTHAVASYDMAPHRWPCMPPLLLRSPLPQPWSTPCAPARRNRPRPLGLLTPVGRQ